MALILKRSTNPAEKLIMYNVLVKRVNIDNICQNIVYHKLDFKKRAYYGIMITESDFTQAVLI